MALLIDWIPRPKFQSTVYTTAIIADDEEYFHHYDSDNNYSDSSSSDQGSGGCLSHLRISHRARSCSLLGWLFKPFKQESNTTMPTRSPQNVVGNRRWYTFQWCRCSCCQGRHSWFSPCPDTDVVPSWISSDDSDIESRLGFRNENAIMASTAGTSPPQQLQNRLQHSLPINNSHNPGRLNIRHSRLRRKYQDEERRAWFFWLIACSEMVVVLLVCLLALLNAVSVFMNTVHYLFISLPLILTLSGVVVLLNYYYTASGYHLFIH